MKAQEQLVRAGKRNEKMLHTEKARLVKISLITWNRTRDIPFRRKSQCKRSNQD